MILVTNDDGIQSPGLWAAVEAVLGLGRVVVVAPREQQTSSGRSLPTSSDGRIEPYPLTLAGQAVEAYAVGATPAQAVLHALLEILPGRPDLVVAGVNYGENVGTAVTTSGTVGAALEAASLGIPSLAVSLQMPSENWYAYEALDFGPAIYFTRLMAQAVLERGLPADADLLKVEVPAHATLETPWKLTRQSRQRYFEAYLIRQGTWSDNGSIAGRVQVEPDAVELDSDVHAMVYEQVVAVTPLSIDLTSRVDFGALAARLRG